MRLGPGEIYFCRQMILIIPGTSGLRPNALEIGRGRYGGTFRVFRVNALALVSGFHAFGSRHAAGAIWVQVKTIYACR